MAPPSNPYQPYADVHENMRGPGDQRPTALQIITDCNAADKMKGKVVIITGANTGIGAETARALYETGAQLVLTARNMDMVKDTIQNIKGNALIENAPDPQTLQMHLDSFDSVRRAADDFKRRFHRLDILICNAGIMASPQGRTQDGLELQIGTNYFAHFLFFQQLKPILRFTAAKTGSVRVITVSSSAHRRSGIRFEDMHFAKRGSYDKWVAYGQSKTALIYMANSIERRYGSEGLHGLSLHPGGVYTDLPRHLSQDEMKMFDGFNHFFKNAAQGAATQVWAAVSPHFEHRGGVHLSDVGEAGPYNEERSYRLAGGYVEHTYDEGSEERLWKLSCETTGLSLDDYPSRPDEIDWI